tara:strand:+ start:57 stop:323 length:267 start_codon:yes stop_codon:yes gene_type:complete
MNTLMIFVLVLLGPGGRPTGTELYFVELTSCIEYRDALVYQSTHIHNYVVGRKTSKFDAYCEVRLIPQSEAGKGKYIFRDPTMKKKDE